eukprot:jgi/Astpho2/4338/Aster-07427
MLCAGSSTFNQALFNSVNILMGVGLLSIPYALKEGGWASLGVLGLLWACTNYTGKPQAFVHVVHTAHMCPTWPGGWVTCKILIKCQEVRCNQACTLNAIQSLPAPKEDRQQNELHNKRLARRNAAAEELNSARIGNSAPLARATLALTARVATLSVDHAEETMKQAGVVPNDQSTISGCLLQSYEDIGQAAFGSKGRAFITWVLYTELIGTCALFYILEGDHLVLLLQSLLGKHAHLPSQGALMGFSAGLFLPTTWLSDLGALSYVGIMGMLSAFGLTGVVVYNFFEGGIHLAKTAPLHIHTLPVTFGLSAFVFAGHAVFPSIYRSMKDRSQYPRMLDYTYAIVGLVCVLIGAAGYCQYGSKTLEEVTLNLRSGPLQLAATALILVSPFTKFALTLEPVAQGVDKFLMSKAGNRRPSKTRARLTRTGLGLGALLLATSIPYFGYFMAVIGSFLTLTVSVIFPSACYLRLYGDSLSKPEKLLNYGVITLGILCATSGTAVSVHDLLQEM